MTKPLQKKLDDIRDRITAVQDQREDIEAAPLARTEAEALIDRLLDWVQSDPIEGMGPAGLAGGSFDEREMLAWLRRPGFLVEMLREQIKAGLLKRFDTETTDTELGLVAADRRAKLKQLDAEILELEAAEEALIEQLQAEGVDVIRRPEADARQALGIEIPRTAA